jgi:hypothetical protein
MPNEGLSSVEDSELNPSISPSYTEKLKYPEVQSSEAARSKRNYGGIELAAMKIHINFLTI